MYRTERHRAAVIWRSGALGDFVLTLPVIRAVRARVAHLTMVGPRRYGALFGRADRWIDADGLEATGLLSGRVGLDADVGLAWSGATAAALRSLGVREVFEGGSQPPIGTHQVDALWAPARPWLGPRDRDPEVDVDPELVRVMAARFGRPVVLCPGSGGARKRWQMAHWHEVARRIREPLLWVGGPQERGETGWGAPACFDLGLAELAALARCCSAWLGPDAGPQHLAAAAGAPVGVVFTGATDPGQWAAVGSVVWRAQ